MRGRLKRRIVLGLLLVLAAGFGCNPIMAPFYLLGGFNRTTVPPELEFYKIAKKEKDKKEIKLLVLPERGRGLSPDFFGQERALAAIFVQKLEMAMGENKEKVKIVPLKEVQAYQQKHQDWKGMRPQEIGKDLGADYVLDMELSALTLFEPRSYGQFMRGSCRLALTLVDVAKEEPLQRWDLTPQYPKNGKNEIADMDKSVDQFREEYFGRVAARMVRFLTATPTPEHLDMDF